MAAKKPVPIDANHAEKWKKASEQASKTAAWAKTMTKVVISQNNRTAPFWHVVNFLGPGKCEPTGVVDLMAIRKNHGKHTLPLKRGDLLEIILIQVKGGSARMPTPQDRERLRLIGKSYSAKAIVLSEWKKGSKAVFSRLVDDAWKKVDPAVIFALPKKTGKKAANAGDTKKTGVASTASPTVQSNAATKAWITRRAGRKVDTKR